MVRFLGREYEHWVTGGESNWRIFVDEERMRLRDYADSLNLKDKTVYGIDNSTYLMKSVTTRIENVGKVHVVISPWYRGEKFFATNRSDWCKPKRVIYQYLRRWDIKVFHCELKQDWLRHLHLRTYKSLLGTAKLSWGRKQIFLAQKFHTFYVEDPLIYCFFIVIAI